MFFSSVFRDMIGEEYSSVRAPSSPLKIATKKRRLSTDFSKCVICQSSNPPLSISTDIGIQKLKAACVQRQDAVWQRLTENPDHATSGVIKYHRTCYASHTSHRNLQFVQSSTCPVLGTGQYTDDEDHAIKPGVSTRADIGASCTVDWKKVCFICLQRKKGKDHKLHVIETVDLKDTFVSLAQARQDYVMLTRLATIQDLVHCDGRYHSSCKLSYIKASPKKSHEYSSTINGQEEPAQNQHKDAFSALIDEIHDELFVHHKVFFLIDLLTQYKKHLQIDTDTEATYTTAKLKQKLIQYYGDAIHITPQRGQSRSSFVISSKVSLGDALKIATKMKADLHIYKEHTPVEERSRETDLSLVHRAMGIIRREMKDIPNLKSEYYPTCDELSLTASAAFVPPLLYQAILWLIEKDTAYEAAGHVPTEDIQRKCLATAECIIYNHTNKITPLHLGMAIEMQHEHGKRSILETMNSHGFCVTYDEFRQFDTSLALDVVSKINNGVFVPDGMVAHGGLLQEGDDNVDLNIETVDGKNTLHEMARVMYQNKSTDALPSKPQRIKATQEKSLKLSDDVLKSLTQIIPYNKPAQRPEPPRKANAADILASLDTTAETFTDQTWVLLRMLPRSMLPYIAGFQEQRIPFWTGYHKLLHEDKQTKTTIGYKPVLNGAPTNPATVYTTMKHAKQTSQALHQSHAVQTFDMQLYIIAQQIKHSNKEEFGDHVLCLGGFHQLCCFISAIGKIWGSAGLRDMLVESDVYAGGTADRMLAGNDFSRAPRGLTLIYETLRSLWFEQFFLWCHEELIPQELWLQLRETAVTFSCETNPALKSNSIKELHNILENLQPVMDEFNLWGCELSPTFKLWLNLIDTLEVFLKFIRSQRTGSWQAHLEATYAMLPYMFAADKHNYARWTPVYLLEMLDMPEDLKQQFEAGDFSIRETESTFNGIWTDLAVEKTVIKDSKSESGIKGFARQEPAIVRWCLTRQTLGEYASAMKERSGHHRIVDQGHGETKPASMKKDEDHVGQIISHVKQNMTNPFDVENHPEFQLINISTGLCASEDVQTSLILASSGIMGKQQMDNFFHACLTENGARKFYDPLPKSGMMNFDQMTKKTDHRAQITKISLASELVFRRALTLADNRPNVTMESVLKQPIVAIPTALFHDDGSMRRCQKSDLMHKLEDSVNGPTAVPDLQNSASVVYIRDAVAELHAMKGDSCKTFKNLAENYTDKLFGLLSKADTVVDVWDQYSSPNSVKQMERDRRGDTGGREYQVIEGRAVPKWQKFLAVSSNKASLSHFIGEFLQEHAQHHDMVATEGKVVHVAGAFNDGTLTLTIRENSAEYSEHLRCDQEEADTRMIFHALKSDQIFRETGTKGQIILKSPDTDVVVLAAHYFPSMESVDKLWVETGHSGPTAQNHRFIPVHELCQANSSIFLKILPAIHAITGCDSSPSFYRVGKKTVVNVVNTYGADHFKELAHFGSRDLESDLTSARQLVAALYDPKQKHHLLHSSLTSLRVQLAKKDVALNQLPPAEASFTEQVKRARWQTKLWTSSHLPQLLTTETPEGNGWHKADGGKYVPTFFTGPTSADTLKLLFCTCRGKNLCTKACPCKSSGLSCCSTCSCSGDETCHNIMTHEIDISDEQELTTNADVQ